MLLSGITDDVEEQRKEKGKIGDSTQTQEQDEGEEEEAQVRQRFILCIENTIVSNRPTPR